LDNDKQTVEDNVVTEEVFSLFKTPTFEKFKVNFWRNYLVSGELYIKPIRNPFGETIRFDVLDSRAVTKVLQDGVITSFRVTTNNGMKTQVFPVEEI
jgi:hypothetical protein